MLRFGFGNGWWYIIFGGRLSVMFSLCILFLNRLCSGLSSFRLSVFGRLLMLWWFLIVVVFFVLVLFDLIIFG